jgi:mono/diheme cytochrome c family protein
MRLAFLVVILGLAPLTAARAQDVAAGRQLAQHWCSSCHAVDAGATTPHKGGPPAFAAIANMSSTTETSLAVFLSTSHEPMPNIVLSHVQIADLSAYILSLRKKP